MAVDKKMTSSEAMPPPPIKLREKRSDDEMHEESKSAEGSQTVMPELAQLAHRGEDEDQDIASSAMMMPDSQTPGRSQTEQRTDAPFPSSAAHPQAVPPSAQGHRRKAKVQKPSQAGSKKGNSAAKERVGDEIVDDEHVDDDSMTTDASHHVGDPIQDFDWNHLNERYLHKMTDCQRNEQAILQDFGQLVQYFHVWAESGNVKDSDRSLKRFKTQEFYVHHEEDELERKRQHYIRVVAAFQIAHLLVEHSPNLAKDVVMRQLIGNPTAREKEERPRLEVLSSSIPYIKYEDFPDKVAGDIDVRKYKYRAHYGSRCVIL